MYQINKWVKDDTPSDQYQITLFCSFDQIAHDTSIVHVIVNVRHIRRPLRVD